ncbi:CBS domain-containing protein [Rhizobium gallicum bv. gallicum R602sp]|uniref:CBS domain-containing protein n=2 Tax=Rhizobium gallicum TaxID=56730 RepID=A0A0B4X3C7_9HYPH|nr:CBS domain-containing protein [Rhizobium gallicum bv. gallicum R602sp]
MRGVPWSRVNTASEPTASAQDRSERRGPAGRCRISSACNNLSDYCRLRCHPRQGTHAKIADVMTAEVKYCFEDEDIDHELQNLGDQQIRRLPVVDRDKRLVGILSLGDVVVTSGDGAAGPTLSAICRPGEHSQTGGASI